VNSEFLQGAGDRVHHLSFHQIWKSMICSRASGELASGFHPEGQELRSSTRMPCFPYVLQQLPFTPSVYASGAKTRGGVKTKALRVSKARHCTRDWTLLTRGSTPLRGLRNYR